MNKRTLNRFSRVSFYRLDIPKIFNHLERVLYIDVDTIVRCDLLHFYNQDFENNYCICRKDVRFIHNNNLLDYLSGAIVKYNNKIYLYKDLLISLGLSENALDDKGVTHINTGVLLLNITKILLMPDQDIIRIVFEDKIKYCEKKYNYLILPYDLFNNLTYKEKQKYKNYLKTALILHYNIPFKPTRFNRLYKIILSAHNEFYKYYQMSYLRINPIKLWFIFLFNHLKHLRLKIIGIKTEFEDKKVFYFWRLEFVIKKAKSRITIV